VDALIGNIIFVLPGLVAYFITRRIGPAESKPRPDFEKTAIGLLYNIPGLLLMWLGISIGMGKAVSFQSFQSKVLSMPYLLIYLLVVFISALISALLWDDRGQNLLDKWVNKKRLDANRPIAYDISTWEEFFNASDQAFFAIYPLGEKNKMIFGYVHRAFQTGDQDKGVVLKNTEELKEWFNWFGKPILTYVDIVTKTVYEYYPASAWEDAKRRVEEHKTTSSEQVVEEECSESLH
jgi:hypothetical protein